MLCTVFCCYLRSMQDSLVTESGCSGNDGAGKLFWGIKNLSSCCFLVAIKFFSHFLVIANVNMLNRMQMTNQALRNKTL